MENSVKVVGGKYLFVMLPISTEFGMVSSIFLSRITPKLDGITVDHLCGFRRNRSTADQIMSAGQMLERKWDYSGQCISCL
jgi:hypothetical protein